MYRNNFLDFRKSEECWKCGARISVKQKRCSRCKEPNPDYQRDSWVNNLGKLGRSKKNKDEEDLP